MACCSWSGSSGGAPRRSHTKYSTFPAGPGSGLAAIPWTPRPSCAAAPLTFSTAAERSVLSRTTPPAPTRSLPTSNWGLTSNTKSASGVAQATRAGSTKVREMNDKSATTRSGSGTTWPIVRTLTRFMTVTRGSVRSDQASWP